MSGWDGGGQKTVGEENKERCPDCKAPLHLHEQGFCPHEIETGERTMHSELTGKTYRVTKWVDKGDGKFISLQKEEISPTQDTGNDRIVECEGCGETIDRSLRTGYVRTPSGRFWHNPCAPTEASP